MNKIFKYELRRLILNKFFIGLLVINCVYGWYILTTETIAGVAYTAPFSIWSFGAYLASVLPFCLITLLFMISTYYTKKEKQVEVLTTVTPVNKAHYALVRNGAITVCFMIICLVLFAMGIYFNLSIFDYSNFPGYLLPFAMLVLPCFLFTLGFSHLVGRVHQGLLYVLMVIVLILGFVGFSSYFDFFSKWYFSKYPLTLPLGADGEPVFTITSSFVVSRFIYLAIGGILLIISISTGHQKARRA